MTEDLGQIFHHIDIIAQETRQPSKIVLVYLLLKRVLIHTFEVYFQCKRFQNIDIFVSQGAPSLRGRYMWAGRVGPSAGIITNLLPLRSVLATCGTPVPGLTGGGLGAGGTLNGPTGPT